MCNLDFNSKGQNTTNVNSNCKFSLFHIIKISKFNTELKYRKGLQKIEPLSENKPSNLVTWNNFYRM